MGLHGKLVVRIFLGQAFARLHPKKFGLLRPEAVAEGRVLGAAENREQGTRDGSFDR